MNVKIVSVTISKDNVKWIKKFNREMEKKRSIRFGVSMILNTIINMVRSNIIKPEEVENTIVTTKLNIVKENAENIVKEYEQKLKK